LLIAMVSAAAACSGDDSEDGPIKIGYAAAVTGELAAYDSPSGVQCAIDRVNDAGGVLGRQLELVVKDMASDPVQAGTVGQELLDEGVALILGPPTDDTALPIAQVAAGSNVAVLAVTATQPALTQAADNAFMTAYGDNQSGAVAAEVAYESGLRSAWLMLTRDIGSYGIVTPNAFADAFTRLGGAVVGEGNWSYGVNEFGSQVNEIVGSSPAPDVVFFAGPVPDNAAFIRQLRAAGSDAVVYGTDGFDDPAFLEVGQADIEGTTFSTLGFPEAGSALLEFFDDCEARGHDVRNVFTGMGGDAVAVVVAALESAGSAEPADVMEALRGLDEVQGVVTDSITYKDVGGTPLRNIAVVTVQDGEFTLVEWRRPAFIPEPRS
jgi:branched-chain amino acid transport system substrate-binding protein